MIVKTDTANRTITFKITENQKSSVVFKFDKAKTIYELLGAEIGFIKIHPYFYTDENKYVEKMEFVCFDREIMKEAYSFLSLELVKNKLKKPDKFSYKIADAFGDKKAKLVSWLFNKEKMQFIDQYEVDIYKLLFNKTGKNILKYSTSLCGHHHLLFDGTTQSYKLFQPLADLNIDQILELLKSTSNGLLTALCLRHDVSDIGAKSLNNIKRNIGSLEINGIIHFSKILNREIKSFHEYLALDLLTYYFIEGTEDFELVANSKIISKMVSKYKKTKKGSRKISRNKRTMHELFPNRKSILNLDVTTNVLINL